MKDEPPNQQPGPRDRDSELVEAAWRQAEVACRSSESRDDTETSPAGVPGADADPGFAGLPPDSFPGYEIVREIHRGGQGVVYQALQQSTKRKVAIKVLLEGSYASKSARHRFEREIELVASLRHPNVISVFHSDKSAGGLRFCVMDYVRGMPLTHYVCQNSLTLENALKLFATVCEAVNHAHQKGVIHRDLKPSNILVDVEGVPRVLDFGLAKMVGGPEESLVSVTGQVVGTLPYMSPEQTRGNPDEIDTRTDVYALGVLLYEMLTGQYPYPVVGRMAEVLKHIAETEPTPLRRKRGQEPSPKRVRGSARASPTQASVASEAKAPDHFFIDDEVQTIALKALAKERERRYQSAGELARDIGRYLAGEPIEAKRDSFRYVLRKQLHRHWVAVAVAMSFALLLVGGFATSMMFWRRTERALHAEAEQRKLADERAEQTQSVADFQSEMLSEIDVETMGVRLRDALIARRRAALEALGSDDAQVEAALHNLQASLVGVNFTNVALETMDQNIFDRALTAVDKQFADQPVIRARLLQTLAATLRDLGLLDRATVPQTEALAIRRRVLGNDHPGTLRSISDMGYLLHLQGKLADAEPYYGEALEGRRRVLGDDPDTLTSINNMGGLLQEQGKLVEAEPYYREALEKTRRSLGDDHPDTLGSINNMGFLLLEMGMTADAEAYYREALEGRRRVLGDDHADTLRSINNMGFLLQSRGNLAEAEPYYREALEGRRRVLGDDHPQTLGSINNMGFLVHAQGKQAEAERYFREALQGLRRVLGDDHPQTLGSITNLGALLQSQGKLAEAESLLLPAAQAAEQKLPLAHPGRATLLERMVLLYDAWHPVEPDKGYDRQAAEWREKLRELETSTQPSKE